MGPRVCGQLGFLWCGLCGGGLEEEGELCLVEDVGGRFGFKSALVVDGGVLVGFAFFDGVEFGDEEVFCVGGGFVEVGEVDGGAGFGVG